MPAPDNENRPVNINPEIELAVEEERRRIAAEIHDEINAAVLVIRLHAQSIARQAAAALHPGIESLAQSIVERANQAYAGMRSISRGLRSDVLDALGLGNAIEAMARELAAAQPTCHIEFEDTSPGTDYPPEIERTAHRVVQEALSNAIKHSQASVVRVELAAEPAPRYLRLSIVDNGRGFDEVKVAEGACGLVGMRERVAACGGEFTLRSDSSGTGITVLL